MYRYRSKILFVWLVALLLSACSIKSAPPLQRFVLDLPEALPKASHRYGGTLRVALPVSVFGVLGYKMRVYDPTYKEERVYHNAQWSEGVEKMLQGILLRVVSQTEAFRTVVTEHSRLNEDYRLECDIVRFCENYRKQGSRANVILQLRLIDSRNGKLLHTKRFAYSVPMKREDAQAYVEATQKIIDTFAIDLAEWI